MDLHPYERRADWNWRLIDAHFGLPSDAEIAALAAAMVKKKEGGNHPTQQILVPDFMLTALFGERHFARVFRLEMNTTVLAYRRGNVNFTLKDGTTVDVQTRRAKNDQPGQLFQHRPVYIPVNKHPTADVVCRVVYYPPSLLDAYEEEIVGWEWTKEIVARGRREPGYRANQAENIVWDEELLKPLWRLMMRHRPDDFLAREPVAEPAPPSVKAPLPDEPTAPLALPMFGDYELGRPKRTRRDSIDAGGDKPKKKRRQ